MILLLPAAVAEPCRSISIFLAVDSFPACEDEALVADLMRMPAAVAMPRLAAVAAITVMVVVVCVVASAACSIGVVVAGITAAAIPVVETLAIKAVPVLLLLLQLLPDVAATVVQLPTTAAILVDPLVDCCLVCVAVAVAATLGVATADAVLLL